jgi:hypothetical protein
MRASGVVDTSGPQEDRGSTRASIGRRIAALVGRGLCAIAVYAWIMVYLFVPAMLAVTSVALLISDLIIHPSWSFDGLSFDLLVEYIALLTTPAGAILGAVWVVVGAVLWSVGQALAGETKDELMAGYGGFEAAAREAKRSLLLVWSAALLDGFLLVPRLIAMLGFTVIVLMALAVAVGAPIILAVVGTIAAGFIFWWVGCNFFITCS